MIATSLLNQEVCFNFPPNHSGDEEHSLHKTRGVIKSVYLFEGAPRYTVLSESGTLETCGSHQMIVCLDILFQDAVRMIEKEDADR